jgi:hypothetical protein
MQPRLHNLEYEINFSNVVHIYHTNQQEYAWTVKELDTF